MCSAEQQRWIQRWCQVVQNAVCVHQCQSEKSKKSIFILFLFNEIRDFATFQTHEEIKPVEITPLVFEIVLMAARWHDQSNI